MRNRRQADSYEDSNEESDDEIRTEFEAARENGDVYLHLAAQLDDKACGRRLMCEVYQKPKQTLTPDEILLQDIFG